MAIAGRGSASSFSGEEIVLASRDGWISRRFRLGRYVMMNEEAGRRVQTCANEEAACELLERLVLLDTKSGWRVQSRRAITGEDIEPPTKLEVLDFKGAIEGDAKKLRIHLAVEDQGKVSVPITRAIVERIEEVAPETLHLACDSTCSGLPLEKGLSGNSLPGMKSFIFDAPADTLSRQAENSFGELGAILRALPQLERCFISGNVVLGAPVRSNVRTLLLAGNPLKKALLENLEKSEFPCLERLGLCLSSDAPPVRPPALVQSLTALQAPALKTVEIAGLVGVGDFFSRLSREAIQLPWRSIEIQHSYEDEPELRDMAEILPDLKKVLPQLEEMHLPYILIPSVTGLIRSVKIHSTDESHDSFLPAAYQDW